MYGFLRQSTASTVLAGPFLAPTDGITAKTALTAPAQVATSGATGFALVKGGARAALAGSLTAPAGWAHDALGYYTVGLAVGDLDTVGRLRLEFVDPSNYAPVHMDFVVLSGAVYDALFGSVALSTYAGGAVAAVAAPVTVGTNNDKSGYLLGGAGLDAVQVEAGMNARQALSPIAALACGKLSGAGTGTIVISGAGVNTTRITATTDTVGNRTGVTLSLPT